MANTLTNLIPDVMVALDTVSRELTGMIPSVSRDPSLERAAKDETIRSHVAPAAVAGDVTPAAAVADEGDQTIGNITMTINKVRKTTFRWSGEEEKGINNGIGVRQIKIDQIAQAFRTLVNEMEADLTALHTDFSRAYGTAGTTPFATAGDYTDATFAAKILKDNGAPLNGNQMVLGTAAGANMLGKQASVNQAGTDDILRQGILLDVNGMPIRESGQIKTHTAGTAASATTDATGYAVGTTTITLASAGTGTILAGDCISFAGDSEKYVVVTGDADVSGGGTVVIQAPGLRKAIPAAATAITVAASSVRNMVFNRSAIVLANRLPALPEDGDLAVDRTIIVDPRSGLPFELSLYAGYRMMKYEIAAAWGVKVAKKEHTALLLG